MQWVKILLRVCRVKLNLVNFLHNTLALALAKFFLAKISRYTVYRYVINTKSNRDVMLYQIKCMCEAHTYTYKEGSLV